MIATQPSLFDPPMAQCHYCGTELTEAEALLPATCERANDCTGCCTRCHHKALGRILRWLYIHRPPGTRKRPGMTYPEAIS